MKHYLRNVNVSHYVNNQFMVCFVTPTAGLYAKYRFPFMVSLNTTLFMWCPSRCRIPVQYSSHAQGHDKRSLL